MMSVSFYIKLFLNCQLRSVLIVQKQWRFIITWQYLLYLKRRDIWGAGHLDLDLRGLPGQYASLWYYWVHLRWYFTTITYVPSISWPVRSYDKRACFGMCDYNESGRSFSFIYPVCPKCVWPFTLFVSKCYMNNFNTWNWISNPEILVASFTLSFTKGISPIWTHDQSSFLINLGGQVPKIKFHLYEMVEEYL